MPRFVIQAQGELWAKVRTDVAQLQGIVGADVVDLNDLGKALAALVAGTAAVFAASGLASVRMEAASKALDRKTPKSELERFARPPSR